MAKQQRDLSLIVWAFGWLLGIATALKKFATKLKVPFEAFERLGSDKGEATIERIVQLVYSDWLDEQPKPLLQTATPYRGGIPIDVTLPPDHYRVYVTNAPLGTILELKEKSGYRSVSPLHDGRKWTRHATRVKDEAPGERIFWVADPPSEVKGDRELIIAWAELLGYQAAFETEAAEFADAHPDALGHRTYILAFGSSAQNDTGYWCVASLSMSGSRRLFNDVGADRGLSIAGRALLIRKASSAS